MKVGEKMYKTDHKSGRNIEKVDMDYDKKC